MTLTSVHEPLRSLRDWLRYAVSRFNQAELVFGHGSDNAYDEAAYLLLHTLNLPADTLEPFLDAQLLDEERAALLAVIERRVRERLPAAYLTGEAWLRGRRFMVDQNVLIPRSPIAELLDEGLEAWLGNEDGDVHSVLDLCTGSGCLAIIAAEVFPEALVTAADISAEALAVAQRNVNDFGLEDRISVVQSNLFNSVPPQQFDLIVCNPPYVNAAAMSALPAEYLHEPQLGLAGGSDGMDLIRQILADAPRYLSEHGALILEIGHERHHFEAAFPHLNPIWLPTTTSDDSILLLERSQLIS